VDPFAVAFTEARPWKLLGGHLAVTWIVDHEPHPQLQASHGAIAISEAHKGGEKIIVAIDIIHQPVSTASLRGHVPNRLVGTAKSSPSRTVVQLMVRTISAE
jgi:hypothetical protein